MKKKSVHLMHREGGVGELGPLSLTFNGFPEDE